MRGGSIASFEVSVHDDIYDMTNCPSCGLRRRASLQSLLKFFSDFLFARFDQARPVLSAGWWCSCVT